MHNIVYAADIELSGFASIATGKVISGDNFLSDYPKAGIYDNDWSFSPDTSVGIQLVSNINTQTSVVIQAVSHGAQGFDVELDWAYLNYHINPEIMVQVGRKRLPLYYYSDHFDIAYTYYWIRPPSDNYTWQISNYNGLSLIYEPSLSEWDALINVYTGRESSEDNDLLGSLSGNKVDETWKNMLGVVIELSKDWLDLRFTAMQGQLDRKINNITTEKDIRQNFLGASVNFFFEKLTVLSEINFYNRPAANIEVTTSMISAGYQIGDFTPHITYSRFLQEKNLAGGDEDHFTSSVGVRWDFDKNIALKLQYDKTIDHGRIIPILGDAELISLSMDLIF